MITFYDFLVENNVDLNSFGWLVTGLLVFLIALYYLPFVLYPFLTLPFVLFGKWNDIKRDKFLWNTNRYIYRKVENLYDEQGYCVNSLYYKWLKKHKLK